MEFWFYGFFSFVIPLAVLSTIYVTSGHLSVIATPGRLLDLVDMNLGFTMARV